MSYYLTPEAQALRLEALVQRIAREPEPFRWTSDYWKLPTSMKLRVAEAVYPTQNSSQLLI